jgi:hypothetical protein
VHADVLHRHAPRLRRVLRRRQLPLRPPHRARAAHAAAPAIYRALYAAKLVAAPLLTLGIGVQPSLAIFAQAFAVELRIVDRLAGVTPRVVPRDIAKAGIVSYGCGSSH